MLDQRGQLLRVAVGFATVLHALVRPRPVGTPHLARLLARHRPRRGFDLQLTQYDDRGWRVMFYTSGMEHSPTSATGTAWERTPWRTAGGVGGVEES